MVAQRLTIDGDVTRFVNDEFPHKVTIYLKDKQITCSGLVLSYHSSVLENKILEENGEIMFDEMYGDENNDDHLENCVKLLHGQAFSDINMDLPSVSILLKFSMWYKVDALFELALELLDKKLPAIVKTDEEFTDLFSVYRTCNTLQDHSGYQRIKQLLLTRISVSDLSRHFEDNGDQQDLSGYDIAAILSDTPEDSGRLLLTWVKLSFKNQLFVIDNLGMFSFNLIFPERKDFDDFISIGSSNNLLPMNKVRALLDIQRQYFTANTVDDAVPSSSGVNNISQECSKLKLNKDEDEKPDTCCDARIVHFQILEKEYNIMYDVVSMIQRTVQGRIRLIKINKCTGVVEFDSIEDASKIKKHLLASDDPPIKLACCVADAEPDWKILWILNLPKNVSEMELRDFLSDCGGINKIKIKRFQKQAHAYVHFICPQYVKNVLTKSLESPDIACFGKLILDFQPFRNSWNMAELKRDYDYDDGIAWLGSKEFPSYCCNIHIYGIHKATTTHDLNMLFEQFGAIEDFDVYPRPQVACIEFIENESASARKAITFYRQNELVVRGQHAYAELCRDEYNNDSEDDSEDGSEFAGFILVENIPTDVTKEYLSGIFSKIILVIDCNEIIDGTALVEFNCTCDRDIVLSYCRENPSVLEVNGNTLTLTTTTRAALFKKTTNSSDEYL